MTITVSSNPEAPATVTTTIPVDVLNTTIKAFLRYKCKHDLSLVEIAYAGEWFFLYLVDGRKVTVTLALK